MRDDDAFRLFTPEEAVGFMCVLVGIAAAFFVPDSPRAKAQTPPPHCEVTIAQYGPGERWVPKPPVPACAGRMVALPNHILTMPVAQ